MCIYKFFIDSCKSSVSDANFSITIILNGKIFFCNRADFT